jgi:pyruvate kinase
MVARGDLGVETSPEEVPIHQKTIIRRSTMGGLPVITATQMLESMIQNPRPTRAEAADVANAVLDGTSAVMLSGETAAGKYPVEAVEMMKRIILKTESSLQFERLVFGRRMNMEDIDEKKKASPSEAVGLAAVELAETIGAAYIACFTHSGGTARLISKYRSRKPVVGFSPESATVRRLALSWGVIPMEIGIVSTVDELLDGAAWAMKYKGLTCEGDFIVITAGVPVGRPGKTNMIKVVKVED